MNIKLILGLGCNMKCKYCYQLNQHNNKKEMSYEILDKFIERVSKLNKHINICLFGGEPLLYKEKIIYLLSKLDKDKVNLSMTTNAYDRNAFYDIREYWGKPISVLVSNKEHKNYNKLGENCSFRWVATKDNINELDDGLIKFLAMEYKYDFHFKYYLGERWEQKDIEKLFIIKAKFRKYLPNFEMELPYNANSKKTCSSKELVISYNGDYLPCHRNLNFKSNKNIFKNELEEFRLDSCIAMHTSNLKNLYTNEKYKFKGANIFRDD